MCCSTPRGIEHGLDILDRSNAENGADIDGLMLSYRNVAEAVIMDPVRDRSAFSGVAPISTWVRPALRNRLVTIVAPS